MDNKGFTLVETLIYVSIIGVVIANFINFGLNVTSSRNKTHVVQEVQSNLRVATEVISSKIKEAKDIISPTEGENDQSLTIDLGPDGPLATFSVIDNVLYYTEEEGVSEPITSNEVVVENLAFTNTASPGDKENISMDIKIRYNYSTSIDYTYSDEWQTAISLRR